jgi:hypothetical protein
VRRENVLAAAAGLVAGIASDIATDRLRHRSRLDVATIGLVVATAIYPIARRQRFGTIGEKAVLATAAAVALGSVRKPGRRAEILATGWIAHAAFDAAFTVHDESRIPAWYPAMCAGYDVGIGVRLLVARAR